MLSMLASAHGEGHDAEDGCLCMWRECLGTYNPLPKAFHVCDRRKCTSGGAEVWRRKACKLPSRRRR